jgi:hypothetical protein
VSDQAPLARVPSAPELEPEPSPPPRSSLPTRSRFARIALLVGALGAAALILPRLPRERQIDFRIDDTASIVGIELAWSREDGDGEAVQGGSWHFAPGQAPRSLTTTVNVPNGLYAVDIIVERTGGRDELRRVIDLSSTDRVTVPLR